MRARARRTPQPPPSVRAMPTASAAVRTHAQSAMRARCRAALRRASCWRMCAVPTRDAVLASVDADACPRHVPSLPALSPRRADPMAGFDMSQLDSFKARALAASHAARRRACRLGTCGLPLTCVPPFSELRGPRRGRRRGRGRRGLGRRPAGAGIRLSAPLARLARLHTTTAGQRRRSFYGPSSKRCSMHTACSHHALPVAPVGERTRRAARRLRSGRRRHRLLRRGQQRRGHPAPLLAQNVEGGDRVGGVQAIQAYALLRQRLHRWETTKAAQRASGQHSWTRPQHACSSGREPRLCQLRRRSHELLAASQHQQVWPLPEQQQRREPAAAHAAHA